MTFASAEYVRSGKSLDPLTPEDVADCVLFAVTRPPHINLDEVAIKALAQSSGYRIVRDGTATG